MIKKFFFYLIAYLIVIVLSMCVFEGTYFVYKKLIRNQSLPCEINLGVTTLFTRDKELGYVLKPSASTTSLKDWDKRKDEYDREWHGLNKRISTNSDGYRGPLYSIKKPVNTLRILALGESTTWGCFNNDGETWPEYLEKILQEQIKNKKIEIINGGVGGYTSAQALGLVKRKFKAYKPDVVLIGLWFNDTYNYDPSFPSPNADFDVNKKKDFFGKKFIYPFPGGRVVLDKLGILFARLKPAVKLPPDFTLQLNNPNQALFSRYYSEDKIWIRNYIDNVNGIMKAIKEENPDAKFYIIAMPTFFAADSLQNFSPNFQAPDKEIPLYHRSYSAKNRLLFLTYYYHTYLFEKLLNQHKGEYSYNVLRGYPAIGRMPLEERGKYFYDEMHLSAGGNYLLAEEIAKQLLASGAI